MLDAWDGETTVVVQLAMPIGLNPGYYSVTVIATSVDDESVYDSVELIIEILETAAVYGGRRNRPVVHPRGPASNHVVRGSKRRNSPDSFAMSLNVPSGMNAAFVGLINGNTPEIDIGASYNVSVEFSFIDGTEGELTLQVIATSVADSSISATGQATYTVGSQNWLRIFAIPPVEVAEEGEVEVNVRIVNQYTTGQRVVMDLDTSESNSWFRSSIARLDKDFTMATGETKEITITVDVTETTLKNLNGDTHGQPDGLGKVRDGQRCRQRRHGSHAGPHGQRGRRCCG